MRETNAWDFRVLTPPCWDDYELIDSGNGKKFERFGAYRLVRPETQAIWEPALSWQEWEQADAFFEPGGVDEGPGKWIRRHALPEQWLLSFGKLAFWARLTSFRHTGVFPEHAAHWLWMRQQLQPFDWQPNVLILFGYTGIASLVAAEVGARVCHVDASRPAMRWARENQEASQLTNASVRWIVEDVRKFVEREVRRGSRYEMIVMDPPVFGRGPKGQVWRLQEGLHKLVMDCAQLLSEQAVGVLISAYATTFSAITLYNVLMDAVGSLSGEVTAGELVLRDTIASRPLSTALYACWSRGFEH
jgi:23S rRNA (cytosine1962-C5)-methyltransferase